MTAPEEFFSKAVEAESRIGKLYLHYSAHFGDDPEASSLFSRLAMEEHVHAGSFRTLAETVYGPWCDLSLAPRYLSMVKRMIARTEETLFAFENGLRPTLPEALEASLWFEDELIEQDRTLIFVTNDTELLRTLVELRAEEESHKSLILGLMSSRGIGNA